MALEVEKDVAIFADAAQLEQALINLVRNAVDAAMQAHEDKSAVRVKVICRLEPDSVVILVEDNGTGLANPANLLFRFTPPSPAAWVSG